GIGSNDLVECGNGIIDLAGVREHRSRIEVILPGRCGIDLCCLRVGLHGIIGLAGLGICFGKVVVVRCETLGCIGIFVVRDLLLLLHLLYLLGRQSLAFGSVFLLFLEVEVQSVLIEGNLEAVDVVKLFGCLLIVRGFVERDFVLAGRDTEGKVFAFVVGLEII